MSVSKAVGDAVQAVVAEAVASAAQQQTVEAMQAQVTAVDGNGRATCTWVGAPFGTRRLSSYTATVGDQVLVLVVAGSPVILGKIV